MTKILTLGPNGDRFELPGSVDSGRLLGDAYGPSPFTVIVKNEQGFEAQLFINPPQITWITIHHE